MTSFSNSSKNDDYVIKLFKFQNILESACFIKILTPNIKMLFYIYH